MHQWIEIFADKQGCLKADYHPAPGRQIPALHFLLTSTDSLNYFLCKAFHQDMRIDIQSVAVV